MEVAPRLRAGRFAPLRTKRTRKKQTEEDRQMDRKQVEELVYQALETELGGVQVYKTAIRCAENEELKEEWEKYGEQTKRHVQIVEGIFERFGLDKKKETSGRQIVREKGKALVAAMEKALRDAPEPAQLVAAECIVDAETK